MTDVQFDENNLEYKRFSSGQSYQQNSTFSMIKILKKFGIKDDRTANQILLAFVVVAIIITIVLFFNTFKEKKVKYNLSPELIKLLPEDVQKKINEANK
jgi:hypothetical protein